MNLSFKGRIRTVYFLILMIAGLITARLFFVQVVKGEYYEGLAAKQYFSSNLEDFNRGDIFFTEKSGNHISAAVVKKGYQVAINPKVLKDHQNIYEKISRIIKIDKDSFFEKASRSDDPYEVVARQVGEDAALKIKDLKIAGVNAFPESWRYYPSDDLASHVLGFVGYKGDKLTGRYGIELQYENALKREETSGKNNSFAELFFDIKSLIAGEDKSGDIILTIEPSAQAMLEKKLSDVKNKYKAEMTAGLVISPKTGKIMAMGANPDFDPNQYAKTKDFSAFINPLVENIYEMGSIAKPLTMAAGLDTGVVTSRTEYVDNGYIDFGSARIRNYDGKARGKADMQKVLNDSLNTGVVFVMQQTGKDKFRDYMLSYGFGEKTGIELPHEAKSNISNLLNNSRDIEFATASFGQGIAVTPVAMAAALSSLANGGVIMRPYIVQEEARKGLKNKQTQPLEIRRALKKETSEEITRMLVEVVDSALLGGKYKMEHYSVAAKTGTAQLAQGKDGYRDGEFMHTFFGYAPAFDPEFLILLFAIKPKGEQYASHTLTEPFMEITKFLLNYYEVPPDR
ncbi:penicillin-binding protein 2 [Candidatus Parcubacteria bacterium]|nr:MAG: penicillin-binding protein 2 [Candidatus Parcubacteria bacterium]